MALGAAPRGALVVGACVVAAGEVSGHLIAQLRAQAATDPSTGLANRSGFRLAAQRQIAHAARGRTALSLVVIGIDDFKTANDTGGHLAGDALLIESANAWVPPTVRRRPARPLWRE